MGSISKSSANLDHNRKGKTFLVRQNLVASILPWVIAPSELSFPLDRSFVRHFRVRWWRSTTLA